MNKLLRRRLSTRTPTPRLPPSTEQLRVTLRGPALYVTMSRPALHNAFNETLIADLTSTFRAVRPHEGYRAVVLAGEGKSFSAGADMNWMRRMASYSEEDNRADALRLFDMFHAVRAAPVPTVARVHGAALGGGSGLVAACDMAFAVRGAALGFTEVRLGLVPAVISRFVMDKVGHAGASRLFLTGERFSGGDAERAGLVNRAVDTADELDDEVDAVVAELARTSPAAAAQCKELIAGVSGLTVAASRDFVAGEIARARVSAEGQEGLAAFLEKRKPSFLRL